MRTAAKAFVAVTVVFALWRTWFGTVPEPSRRVLPSRAATSAAGPAMRSDAGSRVEMPSLVGVDDSFAKHVLERDGLRPGTIRLEPSTRPWGSVIAQSIAPGVAVTPGARVDLVLAKGSVPEPCRLYWCSTGTVEPPIGSRLPRASAQDWEHETILGGHGPGRAARRAGGGTRGR